MNDLILFAMREEAPSLFAKYKNVFCVGVGKVNSALNTMLLIQELKPTRVINLGTAGGLTVSSGIYRINNVFQHDVNLKPVGLKPGQHLNDPYSFINLGNDGKTCASGDLFVTQPNKLRIDCDIVEMEAYSIAKACLLTGTQCDIWKYISDKADENANVTWQEQVAAGEGLYIKVLQDLNVKLEEK
jgi:adenosylhomocysteine nucleosidase